MIIFIKGIMVNKIHDKSYTLIEIMIIFVE